MSFSVERVTQVVLGARQEIEKAKLAKSVEPWKGEMIGKELENLATILKLLTSCTDATTAEAILKQIFLRAKDIWVYFKNEKSPRTSPLPQQVQQPQPTQLASPPAANTLAIAVQDEVETPEKRREREEAARKAKEEQEWRERTARIKREREEKEKTLAKEREEREERERLEKWKRDQELAKQKETEAERLRLKIKLEQEAEAAKKGMTKKEKKKDEKEKKKKKKEEEKEKKKKNSNTPAPFVIRIIEEEDLGLSNSPDKDRKHQEWDSEIKRLNAVVNEKVRNMERRRSRRQLVAGSMMIPNTKTKDSSGPSLDTVFKNQSAAFTRSTPSVRLPDQQPASPTSVSPKGVAPTSPNSRIATTAALFEKPKSPGGGGDQKARPQTMLFRPSSDSRPSASALAGQIGSGNQDKINEMIQKAGREATTAAQLLLKKDGLDAATLNSAIRMMVINFKSCTEYLTSDSQKKLKDSILDVCMSVLLTTKDYLTHPTDQGKKGLLVKEVAKALTIIKDYNLSA